MTQRQKIHTQLLQMNKQLKLQQNRVRYYKQSLDDSLADKRIVTLAMLPLLYVGWKAIRLAGISNFLKDSLKLLLFSSLANIRSRFFINIRNIRTVK